MSGPDLTLDQGKLKGSTAVTLDGVAYYKFQGIPYAKLPTGKLRFKAPVPLDKWDGVLDATKEGDPCYNLDFFNKMALGGSENCLFLNVYTKKLGDSQLKPVLFWIHGGGFMCGSGSSEVYGPDFLLNEDVVVVTINYRLGLFGFLALKDPALEIPGNAGFKDMVLALKWVQKNISKFGGDPGNVTIFGESAGGSAVHLLVLSPLAKGLFHRAIAQRGCATNPWARGAFAYEHLASTLNLPSSDETKLLEHLLTKTTEEISELATKIGEVLRLKDADNLLGYVLEEKSAAAFLFQDPFEAILTGNYNEVPFIIGYNTLEGAVFDLSPVQRKENIPFAFEYPEDSQDREDASNKMRQFYNEGDEHINQINLLSDKMFLFDIFFAAKHHARTSKAPVYMYRLSIDASLRAFHSDDLGYLFKSHQTPEIKPGSVEDISRRRIVRLWTNFAKSANPTPDVKDALLDITWKPLNENLNNILSIDEKLTLLTDSFPESERIAFWNTLLKESPLAQEYIKYTR